MPSNSESAPVSKGRLWAGRILSAVPIVMLLFSGVMKLIKSDSVVQGFARYGYFENLMPIIGVLELACTAVYARSAYCGARGDFGDSLSWRCDGYQRADWRPVIHRHLIPRHTGLGRALPPRRPGTCTDSAPH